jgi:hypothetical protein
MVVVKVARLLVCRVQKHPGANQPWAGELVIIRQQINTSFAVVPRSAGRRLYDVTFIKERAIH